MTDAQIFEKRIRDYFRPMFEWIARQLGYDDVIAVRHEIHHVTFKAIKLSASVVVSDYEMRCRRFDDIKFDTERRLQEMLIAEAWKAVTITEYPDVYGKCYEANLLIGKKEIFT